MHNTMKHLRLGAALLVAAVLAITSLSDMPGASASTPGGTPAPTATTTSGQGGFVPASAKGQTTSPRISTAPFGRRLYFGAISVNILTWGYGYSYDYRTKYRAQQRAQRACINHSGKYWRYCRKVVWVRNGCAAADGQWQRGTGRMIRLSWGIGFTKRIAKRRAYAKLYQPKRNITWVCTTRYR